MAGTEGGSREVSDKYTERNDLPVENPGVEPHVERYTDANPKAGNRQPPRTQSLSQSLTHRRSEEHTSELQSQR